MEPQPVRPPWLPVATPPVPPPVGPEPPPAPPPRAPRFSWRRITRSPRGAAGVAIVAAALLLWPFSGWSILPWLAGLGALVVLRLLRLDGLLRGWDPHLAGLVVVAGLMVSTGPWSWALAASLGVLLAGLAQLPWWRLAAAGAVLCLVSGIGYGFATYQGRLEREQIEARAGDPLRGRLGETRPERVLPAMLQAVELDDADPVCRLLTPPAEAQLLATVRAPDCASAVAELHRRSGTVPETPPAAVPPPVPSGDRWLVDACPTAWAAAAGPELGRVAIGRTDPTVQRFAVTGFERC